MWAEIRALIDTVCELNIRNIKTMAEGAEQSPDHHTAQEMEKTEEPIFFLLAHLEG